MAKIRSPQKCYLCVRNGLCALWYAWRDSNARPSVPETDALVQLSYRRTLCFQRVSGTIGYHFTSSGVHMVSIAE
jgi:hypothetical protein